MPAERTYVLDQAIRAVRPCGVVSVPGVYGGPVTVDMGSIVQKGLRLCSGQTHVKRYLEPLTKLIQEKKVSDTTFLITHRSNDLADGPRSLSDLQKQEGRLRESRVPSRVITSSRGTLWRLARPWPSQGHSQRQIERVEQVFEMIGKRPQTKPCEAPSAKTGPDLFAPPVPSCESAPFAHANNFMGPDPKTRNMIGTDRTRRHTLLQPPPLLTLEGCLRL